MSEKNPADKVSGDLGEQQDAPDVGNGTDITAEGIDVSDEAVSKTDTPATSDPDEYVDDGALGGTGGPSPGGAG